MNIRCFHIPLMVWFLTVVPVFAESFPNRPTAYQVQGLVISGTQCARGVNERCWATQYSTNPVSYHVAPFTNDSCWYLDQSLMGTMASKAKELVTRYANPDTVYSGTMNITMLTVAGVWEELEIGDHTSQFTQTFATGTNAATYGDSPWRICYEHLDERYDVLNVCKKRLLGSYAGTSFPTVVRTAKISGEGDTPDGGYCNVWYPLYGANLGPANGVGYNIEIDTRQDYGAGGVDYISFGVGTPDLGMVQPGAFELTLDSNNGDHDSYFSAGINLDAGGNVVQIMNCWFSSGDGEDNEFAYSSSSVRVSATLDRTIQAISRFGFYAVINFPFEYCK